METGTTPALFIYRGQLSIERSRIEFLLDLAIEAFGSIDVIHLFPGPHGTISMWDTFTQSRSSIASIRVVDASVTRAAWIRRNLRRIRANGQPVVAVGFSVAAFLPDAECDVWCVNGIPEERLLTHDSILTRGLVKLSWTFAKRIRARTMITVSRPMSDLMRRRLRTDSVIEVPNTVDTATFDLATKKKRPFVTYLGGASPWQGLDRLRDVWSAMYALDQSLQFRVVSHDPRASVLGDGLPTSAIECVSAQDPAVVARWMSEAKLAFLYRAPNLVNRVSWPMKFGEYVAAGVPCVVSRVGWDLEGMIKRFGVGIIVDWHDDPNVTAANLIQYLGDSTARTRGDFVSATQYLANHAWLNSTARLLRGGECR